MRSQSHPTKAIADASGLLRAFATRGGRSYGDLMWEGCGEEGFIVVNKASWWLYEYGNSVQC